MKIFLSYSHDDEAVKISILENKKKLRRKDKSAQNELQAFVDRTLGVWADLPEVDKAFVELEERWDQWREETLS